MLFVKVNYIRKDYKYTQSLYYPTKQTNNINQQVVTRMIDSKNYFKAFNFIIVYIIINYGLHQGLQKVQEACWQHRKPFHLVSTHRSISNFYIPVIGPPPDYVAC